MSDLRSAMVRWKKAMTEAAKASMEPAAITMRAMASIRSAASSDPTMRAFSSDSILLALSATRRRIAAVHAPEAQMRRRGVHRLRHSRGRPIATAVVGRTQVRAALHDLARNAHVRLARIEARIGRAAARVGEGAARVLDLCVLLVPVQRPLPHIGP